MAGVQIIGAGNAGCYLAQQLKKQGIAFEIFEEHEEVGRPPHCTGLVSKNIDELLDIPDSIVLNKVKGAKLFSPGGACLELTRKQDEAYVFDRVAFDQEIAKGLDINFGKRVDSLDKNADYIVGADGPNSEIAKLAGFPEIEKFLTGVQVEIANTSYDRDFVELHFGANVAPGFFAWVVPTDKTLKVGLAASENPSSFLEKFLKDKFEKPEILDRYGGPIPLKWREQIAKENVALVGDSAGQVKPTTGGGVYMGLSSAQILSNAIAENDLGIYQERWNAEIKPELNHGLKIRNGLNKMSDAQLDKIWGLLNREELKSLILEHGDMDKPTALLKKMIKNPALLAYLPYLRHLL